MMMWDYQHVKGTAKKKPDDDDELNINNIQFENNDPNFDRKLDEVTAGLQPYLCNHLVARVSRANAKTIKDYIRAIKCEVNPMDY
jgi:hypothetical protein